MSLRTAAAALSLVLLVLVAAFLAADRYYLIAQKETVLASEAARAASAASELSHAFEAGAARLQTVATLPVLRHGFGALQERPAHSAFPAWTTLHYIFFESEIFTGGIYLLGVAGDIRWEEPADLASQGRKHPAFDVVNRALGGHPDEAVVPLKWDGPDGTAVVLAAPVVDDAGLRVGVLLGVIPGSHPMFAALRLPDGPLGALHLVDDGGRAIWSHPSAPQGARTISAAARDALVPTAREVDGDAGRAVVGMARLPWWSRWVVVTERPSAVVFREIRELERLHWIFGVAALGVALLAIWMLVFNYTRPIQALTRTALQRRDGDLASSFRLERDDEIGALARTLDEMGTRIEASAHALTLEKERLRLALAGGEIGTFDWDVPSGHVEWDDRFRTFLDEAAAFSPSLATLIERLHPQDRDQFEAGIADLLKGEPARVELDYRVRGAGGRWVSLLTRFAVIERDAAGRPARVMGTTLDLSMRRELEEQLREAQRLEVIGQLTGGLAHDFNNLLTIVIGNLQFMDPELPPDSDAGRMRALALDAAVRASEVTTSLLAVARRQPLETVQIDLNAAVEALLPLVRSSAGQNISLKHDPWPSSLFVEVDQSALANAVINLVINARDAMEGQAGPREIVVRTRLEHVRADERPRLVAGDYAVLSVEDTGPGMSEAVRQRAFEPYFTTKPSGKGTGLGLATVNGFAGQLGGGTSIESREGEGTAVRVYLPTQVRPLHGEAESRPSLAGSAVAPVPLSDSSSQAPAPGVSAKLRVLVVDDEPRVCAMACRWLDLLGYEPIPAHSAEAAISVLEAGAVDLLFTDVVMPGEMDGLGLAREASRRWPDLKILITTAFSEKLPGNSGEIPGPVLQKPYEAGILTEALQRVRGAA